MSYSQVRKLLETRLAAWAAAQSPQPLPVAYQNKSFTRPEGAWIRCTIIHNPIQSLYLDRADRVYSGLMWINLFTTKGGGLGDTETIISSLQSQFPLNLKLADGSFVLRTLSPLNLQSSSGEEDRWVHSPLVLNYRAAIDWA